MVNLLIKTIFLMLFFVFVNTNYYSIAQDISIITNSNVQDKIDAKMIKHIFLGKKTQWNNYEQITFFVCKSDDVFDLFVKKYIGISKKQFKNYWKRKVFTGKGSMPKTFKQIEKIIKKVEQTKGSIAFIPKNDHEIESIRIVKVLN